MSLIGKRIKYVRMKGGWGYGTIIAVTKNCVVAHLDCQCEGEEWRIHPNAIGKWYFVCNEKESINDLRNGRCARISRHQKT